MRPIYRGILYESLLAAFLRATIGIYTRVRGYMRRDERND